MDRVCSARAPTACFVRYDKTGVHDIIYSGESARKGAFREKFISLNRININRARALYVRIKIFIRETRWIRRINAERLFVARSEFEHARSGDSSINNFRFRARVPSPDDHFRSATSGDLDVKTNTPKHEILQYRTGVAKQIRSSGTFVSRHRLGELLSVHGRVAAVFRTSVISASPPTFPRAAHACRTLK